MDLFRPITILDLPSRLAWLEKRIGRRLEPALLKVIIFSHRVLVVDEPAESLYKGRIVIPHTAQERGEAGFIIGLGKSAGLGNYAGGSYEPWFEPSEADDSRYALLGRHIAYRYTAGISIKMSAADDGYSGDIKIMHCKDILFLHNDESDFRAIEGEK